MRNPFKYFKTSSEIIRLAVMMYIRFPLSLRNVEDLLHERGIDITHETVRFWWNRFGPLFAKSIRKRRVGNQRYSNWTWHLDEVFVSRRPAQHTSTVSFITSGARSITRVKCSRSMSPSAGTARQRSGFCVER